MKNFKIITTSLIILLFSLLLLGCSQETKEVVNIYNWGDYIDQSILDEFEDETGIKVNYENYDSNETMYMKIKSGTSNYDLAIPSDYMIEKMIKEDMLEKVNLDNIPNYKLIDSKFKNLAYDKNNEYSVPYMWGTLGILYNKDMVKEKVNSWDILWNPKYKNQILMYDSQRDSIAVALKKLRYSLNSTNPKELEEAKNALIQQKPLVLALVTDNVKDKMINGEAALAVVYSGDAIATKLENASLEYIIPKEGSNLWFDAMVIPKTCQNKEAAEKFINFMCEKEIAYKNVNYIGFSTPHKEVIKMLSPELKNKTSYPSNEELKNCEVFIDLGKDITLYDRIWTEIFSK